MMHELFLSPFFGIGLSIAFIIFLIRNFKDQ